MPSPDVSSADAHERVPEELVEAGFYRTAAEGFDHGLVALAMGQPYWLMPFGEGFRLLVEPQAFAVVREQLARFDRESVGWPPRLVDDRRSLPKAEFDTPVLWAFAVLAVFAAQNRWPSTTDAGALDARALFDHGEAWRLGTALFLHADLGHLVANVLSGIFVFSAVLTTMGRCRGWLLLAAAALAGNLATAALHHPYIYRSIGASTGIFAGLGLLTGHALRGVWGSAHLSVGWRPLFVRLAAGLTVLALYGAGGPNIDVGAHVNGFVAGLVLGFLFRSTTIPSEPKTPGPAG